VYSEQQISTSSDTGSPQVTSIVGIFIGFAVPYTMRYDCGLLCLLIHCDNTQQNKIDYCQFNTHKRHKTCTVSAGHLSTPLVHNLITTTLKKNRDYLPFYSNFFLYGLHHFLFLFCVFLILISCQDLFHFLIFCI
jgi:hypothetical protein